jgi:hypothetical protein
MYYSFIVCNGNIIKVVYVNLMVAQLILSHFSAAVVLPRHTQPIVGLFYDNLNVPAVVYIFN